MQLSHRDDIIFKKSCKLGLWSPILKGLVSLSKLISVRLQLVVLPVLCVSFPAGTAHLPVHSYADEKRGHLRVQDRVAIDGKGKKTD